MTADDAYELAGQMAVIVTTLTIVQTIAIEYLRRRYPRPGDSHAPPPPPPEYPRNGKSDPDLSKWRNMR